MKSPSKKVAFIMLHPSTNYPYNEIRQLFIASELRKSGVDARVFGLDYEKYSNNSNIFGYDCIVTMCPIDTHVNDVHLAISNSLIQEIRNFSPDLIFIKGIDYLLCKIIIDEINAKYIAIIGGVYEHPIISRFDGVLYETEKQQRSYAGDGYTDILSKYIKWDYVNYYKSNKEFDIINVGNFDEERKSQEILIQLAFYKSIVFVGGGYRLSYFEKLFKRNNVLFTGVIDESLVYKYINKSRIMVHCSIWDGYPRAVAQSLACGVPVVGLNNVLDGINDDLITTCQISKITETSLDLLDNDQILASKSSSSIEYMRKYSSDDYIINTIRKLLIFF